MRSDLIDEILSVENHADQIVKDAESRSRDMILASQAKANDMIHQAVIAERERNRKEIEKAEADGERAIEEYSLMVEDGEKMPRQAIDEIADAIIRTVSNVAIFGDPQRK